jgi:hypothetical protein
MSLPADQPVVVAGNTWVKTAKQYWKDFRERALSALWQGAVPILVAAPPATDWSAVKTVAWAAAVGGGAAVLSMAKSIVVRNRGVKNSASSSTKV